jgi:fructose-bisphosphate aldolase class II
MRKLAREKPADFDARKSALPGWAAIRKLCRDRFRRFGAAGLASKIKVIPLAQAAEH